ncbi:MAG: J domain-containing protein [Myxococcota bacterium]
MVEARALELLGIGSLDDLSRDELRRAYLRAVKAHPPERDADGFREVREGYELLQQALQLNEFMATVLDAEARTIASEVSSNLTPPNLEAGSERLPQRAEKSVVEVLRPEEPATPAVSILGELPATLEAEDPKRAGLALADLYELPDVALEVLPPPAVCFRIALQLFASGDDPLARRLLNAFDEHARRVGSASQLDTFTAARWVLLKELVRVSLHVEEPRAVAALANWLLADDLAEAARLIDPLCARRLGLAKELAKQAPLLWAPLAPHLHSYHVRRENTSSSRLLNGLIILGLFSAFRICDYARSSSTTNEQASVAVRQTEVSPAQANQLIADFAFDLTQSVEASDCKRIRRMWSAYFVALRSANLQRQIDEARQLRTRIRNACPDLDTSLEELP